MDTIPQYKLNARHLCPGCLGRLMAAHSFQTQFQRSQIIISKRLKEMKRTEAIRTQQQNESIDDDEDNDDENNDDDDDGEEDNNCNNDEDDDDDGGDDDNNVIKELEQHDEDKANQSNDFVLLEIAAVLSSDDANVDKKPSTADEQNATDNNSETEEMTEDRAANNAEDVTPKRSRIVKNFRCNFCGVRFRTKFGLLRHVRKRHPSVFPCNLCNFETYIQTNLENHIAKSHLKSNSTINCSECTQQISTAHEYCLHIQTHRTYNKPLTYKPGHFKCNLCPVTVTAERSLIRHKKNKHGIEMTPLAGLQCPQCPVALKTRIAYKEHMHTVHDPTYPMFWEKPGVVKESYKEICEICGIHKGSADKMIVHMRTHTGEQPFKCEVCDRRFYCLDSQRRHEISVHRGERKTFPCTMCSKVVFSKVSLEKHVFYRHTKEGRPFRCEVCLLAFKDEPRYLRHVDRHERLKNLTCPVCKRDYTSPTGLKHHLLKFHNMKYSSAACK